MKIEDLKGKLILFKFSEDIKPDLSLFQIYKDELWALVTDVDDMGIWIENPAYELGIWWDEKGGLIPPTKQVKEKVKANIFVAWRFIKAMMNVDDERFQRIKSDRLPGFQSYK
jgi:hypothetical protein